MKTENLISVSTLITHYNVAMPFFNHLNEIGIIDFEMIEETPYIQEEKIVVLEKIIRLYHELEINMEGIDVVLNLLHKIKELENELTATRNRLQFYEN